MSPKGWGVDVSEVEKNPEDTAVPVTTDTEQKPKPPEDKMIFIDIFGSINRSLTKLIHSSVRADVKDSDRHRLFVSFSSGGGSVDECYHIDALLGSWNFPSVAVCGSTNASASTILIAKRDLRLAYPVSRFMLHDMHCCNDGSIAEIEDRLRSSKELRARIVDTYVEQIGLTKKEVERIISKDTWFSATEALNLGDKGLIDGIITKTLGQFKFEILMRNNIRKVVDLHKDDYTSVRDLTVQIATTPVSETEETKA